ncbi:hypothetical protein [Micromonospora pallida]|nr:hypothetical protein [Micromonospora pallida]
MNPERRRRLVALGEWHREWTARHESSTPFDPSSRPEGSDYAQHHVTLDADGAAQDEFFARANHIMGIDR